MNHGPARMSPSQIAILPRGDPGISQDDPAGGAVRVWRGGVPVAFAVALLAAVLWFLTVPSFPATLRRLPAEQRVALVDRTLQNLRDVCRGGGRPREFCRDQATLLVELPECQGACQAQAREELLADSAVK